MTTEKTGQEQEQEEKCPAIDCCAPQKVAEMMTKFGDGMKCDCGDGMQAMMKGGCCRTEQK